MKHTTPCGLATGINALEAYKKALACDPVSAFGSVIAFTVPVDDATALRETVNGLLHRSDHRQDMARRARERALTYSSEFMADGYAAVYDSVRARSGVVAR